MNVITNPQERKRFLKFLVVGLIGAVVDFGTFNLLTLTTAIPAVWASAISFGAAIISNFLWNRFWTYPDSRSKPILAQLVQFAGVSVLGLAIRLPLFAFLEHRLIDFFTRLQLPLPVTPTFEGHNTSLAIAVLVVMLWNFFINRLYTYSDVSSQAAAAANGSAAGGKRRTSR
jgi:putative flippase GtrA